MSVNSFTRKIDYLRLSVTDRCNLRCVYCMPETGIIYKPHNEILTFEEIAKLVRIFVSLGITKIRLTGGEPLVRKGIIKLVESLTGIEGIEETSLTTNGALLPYYVEALKRAGLNRINISLDTLKEDNFRRITRSNCLSEVIKGIDRTKQAGFYPIKLNMVVMKGINDDEIIDFVNFCLSKGLVLRFIEFMKVTPLWKENYFVPIEAVKDTCAARFRLKRLGDSGPGPAVYYKVEETGKIGFINTTEIRCLNCRRLRLTSCGELKICLYENAGLSLKELLSTGADDKEITDIIGTRLELKKNKDINYRCWENSKLYMCSLGG